MSRFSTANMPAGLFRVFCRSEVGAKSFSVIMNDPEFIFEHRHLSQTLIKRKLSVSYWPTWDPGSPLNVDFGICLSVCRRFRIAKCDYQRHHVCPSARPHWTTRLPLEGFLWNFIFDYFSKICRKISGFIKILQEWQLIYIKTKTHFKSCLAQFL